MLQKLIELLSFIDHFQLEMATDFLLEVMALDPKVVKTDDICLALMEEMIDEESKTGDFKKYKHFTMDNFTEEEFKKNFYFDKNGFCELFMALGLKCEYKSNADQLIWGGREGLVILLHRLTYPNRLSDIVPLFGRHSTKLSRIANTMCSLIWDAHHHRLENLNSRVDRS